MEEKKPSLVLAILKLVFAILQLLGMLAIVIIVFWIIIQFF